MRFRLLFYWKQIALKICLTQKCRAGKAEQKKESFAPEKVNAGKKVLRTLHG